MSSVDTRANVVIEAPMGTGTFTIDSNGKVKHLPFNSDEVDWKAFEEAVHKIKKLREENDENCSN